MEFALLLLTILLSATCAGLVTHRLNISKERLSFRVRKAEDVYCTAEQLEDVLNNFFADSYSLVNHCLPRENEADAKIGEAVGQHFSRLKMLIGFYFPGLRPSLSRVTSAAASAYGALQAYNKAPREEKEPLAEILDVSVVEMKEAFEAMKENILTVGAKEHVGRRLVFLNRSQKAMRSSRVMPVAV